MAAAENLMAGGIPATLAKQIGLEIAVTGLVATGSTQAGALALTSNFSVFATVAANTGCIVSGDKDSVISNGGVNPLTVYPPVGMNFNGGTANAGFTVTNGKTGLFLPARGGTIAALQG